MPNNSLKYKKINKEHRNIAIYSLKQKYRLTYDNDEEIPRDS